MNVARGAEHDRLLQQAVEMIIYGRSDRIARQVIAAVARAKVQVGDVYASCDLEPPPPDQYTALVIGLARQDRRIGLGNSEISAYA